MKKPTLEGLEKAKNLITESLNKEPPGVCSSCNESYKLQKEGSSPIGYQIKLLGYCSLYCLRKASDISIDELQRKSNDN